MPYVTRPRALHHRTATFWPGAMVAGGPVQVLSIAARRGSDGRSRLLALGIAYGRLGRASLNQLLRSMRSQPFSCGRAAVLGWRSVFYLGEEGLDASGWVADGAGHTLGAACRCRGAATARGPRCRCSATAARLHIPESRCHARVTLAWTGERMREESMRMGEALEWCCEELGNRARDGSLALSVGIMLSWRWHWHWHWRWRWVVLDQVAMGDQACTPHSAKAPPGENHRVVSSP